ncbi:hypothetical protein M3936_10525 [Sutcliffiella horikoshii]|uniref:hypothetical protein n=1 Tax=Sutcliffiella horikoshii TaxID=79883 RepID=UPI0007D08315|nr:hypothetical protein [Sutcliffiella horikoshii]MCM3618015.1 hypothetical protein [Sutcliffiella horikoshii]
MKKHSALGKVTYWIGFLFFVFGIFIRFDVLDYFVLVPSDSIATAYIFIGISLLLSSNFMIKKKKSENS